MNRLLLVCLVASSVSVTSETTLLAQDSKKPVPDQAKAKQEGIEVDFTTTPLIRPNRTEFGICIEFEGTCEKWDIEKLLFPATTSASQASWLLASSMKEDGVVVAWEKNDTSFTVQALKAKNGKLYTVKSVKVKSKDLTDDQLPKIIDRRPEA